MKQFPLTVLVNILPTQREALLELLNQIGQDIKHNPCIRFPEIERTHFARFVMIGGGTLQDRDAQTRLYFSTNYDGELESYLDILLAKAATGLDMIFSKCEGYPDVKLTDPNFNESFKAFINSHIVFTNTFYGGYRPFTVKEIKNFIATRQKFEEVLNLPQTEALLEMFNQMSPSGSDGGPSFFDRYITANIPELLRLILHPILTPNISDKSPSETSKEVDTRPDITDWLYTVQNEMTVVSAIDPSKLDSLKRILALINFASRYIYTKGNLGGIATIHFARWAIIDNGANLLFESNYDGNWEQYIGDFVDKANLGMDAIWQSTPGYPLHGSRDLQAFKQIIIDHQVRAQVFYSAYPNDSVRNILNDIEIYKGLNKLLKDREVTQWLSRL